MFDREPSLMGTIDNDPRRRGPIRETRDAREKRKYGESVQIAHRERTGDPPWKLS
jgi:hypothetical protein